MAFTFAYSVDSPKPAFQANDQIVGAQHGNFDDQVTGLANGGFAVAWDNAVEIFGPDYERSFISIYPNGAPSRGGIAAFDSGAILVVAGAGAESMFARRYDTAGTMTKQVNMAGSRDGSLATFDDGGFVYVYNKGTNPEQVHFERYDANWIRVAGGRVNSIETTNFTQTPAHDVTVLADGGFVVAYQDGVPGSSADCDIRAVVYNTDGTVRRADFRIAGTGFLSHVFDDPKLAALPDGGFAVAYVDDDYQGVDARNAVLLRSYTANGAFIATKVITFSLASGDGFLTKPDIAVLAGGRLAITWTEGTQTAPRILGRILDADGDPLPDGASDPFLVSANVALGTESNVAGLIDGRFVTSWTNPNDTSGTGVLAEVSRLARTAIGTGEDETHVGDDLDDVVHGRGGTDILYGEGGYDVLFGEAGSDFLFGGLWADTLNGGADADIIRGQAGNDEAHGEGGDDFIYGDDGRDVISGGLDDDSLDGNGGDDTVRGDDGHDTISGGNGHDILSGGSGNDHLSGGADVDQLEGGAGRDTLAGGGGNDIYRLTDLTSPAGLPNRILAYDSIVEFRGGDTDLVRIERVLTTKFAPRSYSLPDNIERAQIVAPEAFNLVGNSFANVLIGNDAANILDGRAGSDILYGLAGDDTFVIDSLKDYVVENPGGGVDLVQSSVSYRLGANQEHLSLLGTAAINAGGNEMANRLTGNSAANTINGQAGADTMTGLAGNDLYVVDNRLDRIVEAANGGVDTVRSTVSFTLGAQQEALILAGAASINATGNALANRLTGNSGSNILSGRAGNDTLAGGAGADRFVFDTALNAATNVDTIQDYSVTADRIDLDNAVFAGLANGVLAPDAFTISSAGATLTSHRVIYNPQTGTLAYDINGSSAGGATLFAILSPGLAMTNAEFFAS